jgi:hypothetical protein
MRPALMTSAVGRWLPSVAVRKLCGLTYHGDPPVPPSVLVGSSVCAGRFSVGITRLAKVFCVPVADDVCDREGARIFVLGALPSGCGSSLPLAGNQRLVRASARILELVLEGDSRWLEVRSSGSTQIRALAS